MNLFKLNKQTYEVEIEEGALMLAPFVVLYKRDKTKTKTTAKKEMAYLYFMIDKRSDYMSTINEAERHIQVVKDLGLPKDWKPDKKLKIAMEFYDDRSKTEISALYDAAAKGAEAVNDILMNAKEYIEGSKNPIKAARDVIETINKIPAVMSNLKSAKKQLIDEQNSASDKKLGSQELNIFEDGI